MNFVRSSEEMFRTTDYDCFKKVKGNRRVLEERVAKILASFDKIGYIPVPIIVNEKYEVIDGQGRLEACKRRGYPVNFIVKPGLKIEDCIVMNINVTPWNLMDYIECYAEIGNESYKQILDLFEYMFETYGKKCISVNNMCTALFGTKKAPGTAIKAGRLVVDSMLHDQAKKDLDYVFSIINYYKENKVRLKSQNMSDLITSILFCCKWEEVDKEKLYSILTQNGHLMQKWTNVQSCINEIDYLYNYNARSKKAPINRLYEDLSKKDDNIASNFISHYTNFKTQEEDTEEVD